MNTPTKTTIVLPEDLLQQAKITAIQQKTTLSKYISSLLMQNLPQKPEVAKTSKKDSLNKKNDFWSLAGKYKVKNQKNIPKKGFLKWSGAFSVKNPIPAEKIRDYIDYSDL